MKHMAYPFRSYLAVAALLLIAALLLGGCAAGTTPASEAKSPEAQQLAAQLGEKLTAAGLRVPPTNVMTVLYGVDGGIACINAGQPEHSNGLWLFGSVNPGRRVIADPKVIAYDEAVIGTYCPDKLPAAQAITKGMQTGATIP